MSAAWPSLCKSLHDEFIEMLLVQQIKSMVAPMALILNDRYTCEEVKHQEISQMIIVMGFTVQDF
jgi:hypothetical protein